MTKQALDSRNVFRSAISDTDGMVDAGYLGFFWVMAFVVGTIPCAVIGLFVAQYFDPVHKFDALMLGQFLGLCGAAFGSCVAAVGLFKRLDRPAATSSTTTLQTVQTKTEAPL